MVMIREPGREVKVPLLALGRIRHTVEKPVLELIEHPIEMIPLIHRFALDPFFLKRNFYKRRFLVVWTDPHGQLVDTLRRRVSKEGKDHGLCPRLWKPKRLVYPFHGVKDVAHRLALSMKRKCRSLIVVKTDFHRELYLSLSRMDSYNFSSLSLFTCSV